MSSSAHKVGELFKAAGQYFSQLGDATVELQLVLDQNIAQSSALKGKKDGTNVSQGTSVPILPSVSTSGVPVYSIQPSIPVGTDATLPDVKNVNIASTGDIKEEL